MPRLVISLATRGRAQQLYGTIATSMSNWTHPGTTLWIMADEDDPETAELKTKDFGADIKLDVRPREDTIAEKWNRILTLDPDADLYMPAADDDPYIVPGYDQKLLDAAVKFPDGIGWVFGRMANASFTGVMAFTRKTIEMMDGKMYVEHFPYWFVDHWADDIARITGRISFAPVGTDQSKVGKTQEMREPGWWATFFDACYLVRRRQAHKIISSPDFQSPDWHKDVLLAHHPLIEYRSRWVNDNVRAQSNQYDAWSGLDKQDARYLRVKNAAKAYVPLILSDPEMPEAEKRKFNEILLPPTSIPSLRQAYA
jgi:hypothetical protein